MFSQLDYDAENNENKEIEKGGGEGLVLIAFRSALLRCFLRAPFFALRPN